jgi:hypothetical protein
MIVPIIVASVLLAPSRSSFNFKKRSQGITPTTTRKKRLERKEKRGKGTY